MDASDLQSLKMDPVIIAIIVVSSFALLIGIIAIILMAIYWSKPAPTPTPLRSTNIQQPLPIPRAAQPASQQPRSPQKIVKTPSKLLAPVKTTTRDISGLSDKLYVIDEAGEKHRIIPHIEEPVVDISYFNDGLLILLNFGNMLYLTHDEENLLEYHLPASENIIMITPYNDTVVGLGYNGRIYMFKFEDEDNYCWTPIITSVKNATYISSPIDGEHLWIQTASDAFCYDNTLDIISRSK